MNNPNEDLSTQIRKLWVRWVLLTLVTPIAAAFMLLLEKSTISPDSLAGAIVNVLAAVSPLIGVVVFLLIILTSIQLASTVGELKNMSGMRRGLFALLLMGGSFLIAGITVFAACVALIGGV